MHGPNYYPQTEQLMQQDYASCQEIARQEEHGRLQRLSVRMGRVAMSAAMMLGISGGGIAYEIAQAEHRPAAAAAAECGAIVLKGSDWLGGKGVDVRSNGANQGTGVACKDDVHETYDLNANPPQFGFGWQCVELANRLYSTKDWYNRMSLAVEDVGAKNIYNYARDAKFPGLTAKANGSGYAPTPGDMIIHGPTSLNSFGHVQPIINTFRGSVSSQKYSLCFLLLLFPCYLFCPLCRANVSQFYRNIPAV